MELKAENRFTVTKELFFEGMNRLVADEYGRVAKKLVIGIAVLCAVLVGVTIYSGGIVTAVIELAVTAFVCVWIAVITPKSRVKRAWLVQESAEGNRERTIEFYEDRMEANKGSDDRIIVNYEDITRVLETPNLLILINTNHLGILVSRSGFTKGDENTVRELIREWSR